MVTYRVSMSRKLTATRVKISVKILWSVYTIFTSYRFIDKRKQSILKFKINLHKNNRGYCYIHLIWQANIEHYIKHYVIRIQNFNISICASYSLVPWADHTAGSVAHFCNPATGRLSLEDGLWLWSQMTWLFELSEYRSNSINGLQWSMVLLVPSSFRQKRACSG